MLSKTLTTREKLPGEAKVYQVALASFLVPGEGLMDNNFELSIYPYITLSLGDAAAGFDLAGVEQIALSLRTSAGTTTTEWAKPAGAAKLRLMLAYDTHESTDLTNEMLVPGTKVWDANAKIASACIQGGEHGEDYLVLWKFRTTTQRKEWEAFVLQVRQDF